VEQLGFIMGMLLLALNNGIKPQFEAREVIVKILTEMGFIKTGGLSISRA